MWVCWEEIVLVSVIEVCLRLSHELIHPKCSVTGSFILLKLACPDILDFLYGSCLAILKSGVMSAFILD